MRLWASLLDPKTAPAQELIELYARRWEHELYYRELKRQLRKSVVLQSHTVETGASPRATPQLSTGGAPALSRWPRLRHNQSWEDPVQFKLL